MAEWEAIEAGQLPDCVEQVYLIASALHLGKRFRAFLVHLCIGVWEQQQQ